MSSEPRCELTDLYVSACACKNHRNSPELPKLRGSEEPKANLLTHSDYQWGKEITALYPGTCRLCGGDLVVSTKIYMLLPPDTPTITAWAAAAIGYACTPCYDNEN